MGNIPLATVLSANGVFFAGIIGFIYSDLLVPPMVRVNAKYYGWRLALYIAGVMYVSIVITALIMHFAYSILHILPESNRAIAEVTRFNVDYTFWLNGICLLVAVILIYLHLKDKQYRKHKEHSHGQHQGHDHHKASPKRIIVFCFTLILIGGAITQFIIS
jgi:hypothetical protein